MNEWIQLKLEGLFDFLQNNFILFGEWCYAQHSIRYNRLPDWFLGFDVFDMKNNTFLSCKRRDELFHKMGIHSVPLLYEGYSNLENLKSLLSTSRVGNQPAEGLYLRIDDRQHLIKRAKLVRAEFMQTIQEHWSRKPLKPNKLIWIN